MVEDDRTTAEEFGKNRPMARLHAQMEQLRRQQEKMMANNEQNRRRLEAAYGAMQRRMDQAEGSATNIRDLGELRRHFATLENRLGILGQELLSMRAILDKQRAVDPMKIATANQSFEGYLRDMQAQLGQLRHRVEVEVAERVRNSQAQTDIIGKLQEYVRTQDLHKADQLQAMVHKLETERGRIGEELRRSGERMQQEWRRGMQEREARLREEMERRHAALQASVNGQLERRTDLEKELIRKSEERWGKTAEELRQLVQEERRRHRERFEKVNEALGTLEKHLEGGHRRMDKVMGAELESRKLHEKVLLSKMGEAEARLKDQLKELAKSVTDVREGLSDIRIPVLDTEALRREMEAIAVDKNKMTMEGLIHLEEKVTRMQQALGHERRALMRSLAETVDEEVETKLRDQLGKMDELFRDIGRTQANLRQKVERKIPENIEELSAKLENVKQQLVQRIDQEEEERFLAVRELQDAYGRLAATAVGPITGNGGAVDGLASAASLKRDMEECKVAIKKLAESLTTVKNVLDRKIGEEIRKREQEVEVLNSRIDTATVHALQVQ